MAQFDFFEAPKRNLHHHRQTGKQGEQQHPNAGLVKDAVVAAVQPYHAHHQRGGGGAGDADKPFFAHFANQRVKQGKAQRGAGAIDKRYAIAQLAKFVKLPVIHNQRGGNAKAHHVGKAVQLFAKRALAVGEAGDAPVHAVQQHGNEHADCRAFVTPVHGLGDGEKGGEQRGEGERIGQRVDAALADEFTLAGFFVLGAVHVVFRLRLLRSFGFGMIHDGVSFFVVTAGAF